MSRVVLTTIVVLFFPLRRPPGRDDPDSLRTFRVDYRQYHERTVDLVDR